MTLPEARDAALTAEIRDVLDADRLLDEAGLAVQVRGGVAHVEGIVGSEEARQRIRRVIGRVRGIHAVWDRLRAPGETLRILDVGCGGRKQCPDAIGVDRMPSPGVQVLADVEDGLPFPDDAADHIFSIHCLEHTQDLCRAMAELHRVLKPTGVLHVMVPNNTSVNALADPTHVRLFHPQTFKFFCRPRPGVRPFRPLSVSCNHADIFVDLQPVKGGHPPEPDDRLVLFFD